MSVDELQEDQGRNEEVCVVSPKNGTTVDLRVTSVSDPTSVDNNYGELVSTRELIDTDKPYNQPDTVNSSSLSYTPRTDSTSALSSSAALPADLTSSFKSHNRIEPMQEGIQKMRSYCAASVSAVSASAVITAACYPSYKTSK